MASRADRFEQLTGAFDDPVAPSPAFAARLREHIVADLAATPASPAASPDGVREDSVVDVSTVPPTPIRRLRPGQRRKAPRYLRWTKPMALVNVAAILLLLVGIVRFFAPDKPAPHSTYRLAAIASQTTGSPVVPNVSPNGPAVMWGANAGQTWQFAKPGPDRANAKLSTIAVGQKNSYVASSVVTNGTIVLSTEEKISAAYASHLSAYDLATGAKRWTIDRSFVGNLAAQGDILFGLEVYQGRLRLVALNLRDGSNGWIGPMLPETSSSYQGPLLAGGKLYVGMTNGQVLVVDPRTGAQTGLLGLTKPVTWNPRSQQLAAGVIAIDGDAIYMTTNNAEIAAYGTNDNKRRWIYPLPKLPSETVLNAHLAVSEGTVAVQSMNGTPNATTAAGEKGSIRLSNSFVSAIDAANGTMKWSTPSAYPSGNLVIANRQVITAYLDMRTNSMNVRSFDLETGGERWSIPLPPSFNAANSAPGFIAISADDNGIYVVDLDKTLAIIDTNGLSLSQYKLPHLAGPLSVQETPQPAWISGATAYIVGSDGAVSVLGQEVAPATPSTSPLASPQASLAASTVAVQPGANPGQTYQYDVEVGTPKSVAMLGAPIQGYIGSSAIVSDGTLYRTRTFYNSSKEEQHSVEAISLADGMSRTVFYDPERAAINLMLKGDDLIILSAPIVGRSTTTTLSVADANGRATRWSTSLFDGEPAAQPLLVGNMVVVPAAAGKLYGVDLTTHKVAWTAAVPSPGNPTPWLAADAENLYAASGFYVTALDPATGATRWQLDLSKQLYGIGAMRVADGQIVLSGLPYVPRERATPTNTPQASAASASARILSISTRDHTVRWHYDAPDLVNGLGPIVDGRVLVGRQGSAPGGTTEALELKSGKVAWTHQGALAAVAAESQYIVIHISGLPQPGQTPATPAPGLNGPQFATPAVERTVTVTGLDPATGAVEWSMGESIGTTYPVAFLPIDRGLVIPLNDGRVMVLRG